MIPTHARVGLPPIRTPPYTTRSNYAVKTVRPKPLTRRWLKLRSSARANLRTPSPYDRVPTYAPLKFPPAALAAAASKHHKGTRWSSKSKQDRTEELVSQNEDETEFNPLLFTPEGRPTLTVRSVADALKWPQAPSWLPLAQPQMGVSCRFMKASTSRSYR